METKTKSLDDVLAEIKSKGNNLDFEIDIPDGLKSDVRVISAVLEHGSLPMDKLPSHALEDKEILRGIVTATAYNFQSFPAWARDDEELARIAAASDWSGFEHASPRLRGKREFVVWAFSHRVSPDSLDHITDESLKDDIEILKLAVKGNSQSFGHLPKRHQANRELITAALEGKLMSTGCFECFPLECRDDKQIALKAVSDDALCFEHLSESLRDDYKLAEIALKSRGSLLAHASARLRDDKALILHAIRETGDIYAIYESMSERLKVDREVAIAAMHKDSRNIRALPPQCLRDRAIVEACMKGREYFSGSCYAEFDQEFRADRAIALRMSKGRDFPLGSVPDALRSDRDIVRNAVKSEERNFEHVPAELKSDLRFVRQLHALNDRVLSYLPDDLKDRLFTTTTVESPEHRGRKIKMRLVLDKGVVQNHERPAQSATIQAGAEARLAMGAFPVLSYEDDGPMGSYLSVRALNNLVLLGDFTFFVAANSGKETFTYARSREGQWNGYGPEPATSDDFLKHQVYLLPESLSKLEHSELAKCPRIYFGRPDRLPRGIQLFPSENSYREALTVLRQQSIHGKPAFERIDASTLRAVAGRADEVAGAARVYVDDHGWRFLIPNRGGALKALSVLKATGDRDDWTWIKENGGALSSSQKALLLEHFAAADFHAGVKALCS